MPYVGQFGPHVELHAAAALGNARCQCDRVVGQYFVRRRLDEYWREAREIGEDRRGQWPARVGGTEIVARGFVGRGETKIGIGRCVAGVRG